MQEILNVLNDKQYEAVVNTEGPVLVIAGAGSGKTKVLTHKIAYIIGEKKALPWEILAITFTNKAANEMKERISILVGECSKDIWMGTFHSICVKILRKHIEKLGFDSSFIIKSQLVLTNFCFVWLLDNNFYIKIVDILIFMNVSNAIGGLVKES